MATHAPNIQRLEANCCGEDRYSTLMHFKSLCSLFLINSGNISPQAFDHWPLLETLDILVLGGEGGVELGILDVRHQKLGHLRVQDLSGSSSIVLSCPSLKLLDLVGTIMVENCLAHLTSMCPKLERLGLDMITFQGEPLHIFLENVEEMTMSNLTRGGVRLTCPRLKILEFIDKVESMPLPNFEAYCPNLKELNIGDTKI